jgi:hypothetical protein
VCSATPPCSKNTAVSVYPMACLTGRGVCVRACVCHTEAIGSASWARSHTDGHVILYARYMPHTHPSL